MIIIIIIILFYVGVEHGTEEFVSAIEAGGESILRNEDFHNLNLSRNVIGIIKFRTKTWINRLACKREMRNLNRILIRKR
jgi:hypothetical protein